MIKPFKQNIKLALLVILVACSVPFTTWMGLKLFTKFSIDEINKTVTNVGYVWGGALTLFVVIWKTCFDTNVTLRRDEHAALIRNVEADVSTQKAALKILGQRAFDVSDNIHRCAQDYEKGYDSDQIAQCLNAARGSAVELRALDKTELTQAWTEFIQQCGFVHSKLTEWMEQPSLSDRPFTDMGKLYLEPNLGGELNRLYQIVEHLLEAHAESLKVKHVETKSE